MPPSNPVVVVPGITASRLRDAYPVDPPTVWSAILAKSYQRVSLHPDDLRYELVEPARVVPDAVFGIPYEELIEELRHDLRDREDESVPVFPFPYDWRQPLAAVEPELERFVREVVDRTRLLRHYAKSSWAEDPRVDLVGHSMGGLLIAGLLERTGADLPVGRVATLGTPFQGSYEAMIKVLTGTASLSPLEPSSREREAARLTPALYHLVPSFPAAVLDGETGQSVDPFDPAAWQDGVLETLAEFLRLHGADPSRRKADRLERARELLATMLGDAKAFVDRVRGLDLAAAGLEPEDWLAIAGVDSETRVRLSLRRDDDGTVRYDLSNHDRRNRWDRRGPSFETGDGTVPLRGAVPPFLGEQRVVCLRPGDLGYWEIGDRLLRGPVGWHGLLPECNLAQRLLVKHFRDRPGDSSVWGRPLPGVSDDDWKPPIRRLRAKG